MPLCFLGGGGKQQTRLFSFGPRPLSLQLARPDQHIAALLLQDLPALSVRALAAYGAMLVGIAVSLLVVRRLMGAEVTVSCDGDFCRMRKHMPGRGTMGGRFGGRPSAE